ncbi:MAG: Dam family site-specific DNA-(adenine-N6)-methyltransferase [Neisseriaceae bacterium]|nr:MAG: Dam family site-specific DNA-(adenine-N6)-methyltransferase [Neisseriaceae bacterium]
MSKPFLKWAGGKAKLVQFIEEHMPISNRKRLIEPFSGSGAVTLGVEFESYVLSDANADLINLFEALKTEKKDFIDYAQSFFTPHNNQEIQFYELRTQFNQSQDKLERSALFMYLNRHAYNGLCRYNSKGLFNVPFGRYKTVYFPKSEMEHFIHKSGRIELMYAHFEETFSIAQSNDLIYCDPPYVPLSETAYFTSYSQGGFNQNQQQKLAKLAELTAKKTKGILISNHDTEVTRKLYKGANIKTISVQRNISSKGSKRIKVNELLAIFK